MTTPNQYTDGYRAASEEALSALRNPNKPRHNPECPACSVMGDVAYVLLEELSVRMTQNELFCACPHAHEQVGASWEGPGYTRIPEARARPVGVDLWKREKERLSINAKRPQ